MQHRQATRRFLATVLFTDIVGSTEHAAELGDRSWRDLLERHHALVRRELKAFKGREMGTAGDGFFAVFDAPERAVRCAESITSAVVSLGLQVRAGVHFGECEVVRGEVAGMAVNIGARVAALAGPGEVLASGSVRDLMTGSDRRFKGGEQRTLKGVAEPWRVYRLVPDDMAGGVAAGWRQPLLPLYTRRQRRRLVMVIAALLTAALALPAAGYLLTRSDPVVVVGEDAVGVIGPGSDAPSSAVVRVGRRPTALAGAGNGEVWVTNSSDDSVSRIDPDSDIPVRINLERGSAPSGIAVGAGAVWVANPGNATVSRIDMETSRVTTIGVRPGPTGITVAFGSVWVTNALDASVSEIDPDTSTVAHVVLVGASPTGIAAGAGYLWVTNQGDGTVTRFDPRTRVKDSPITVGTGPVGIAVAGGAAWVANNIEGSLSRIDVEDLSVTTRTLVKGGGAYGVAASGGAVWVSNEHAGTLMRVTTARNFRLAATVRRLAGAPLGLAFVGDDLWFTSAAGSALHRGGVLTMVATWGLEQYDDAPNTDLTLHYTDASMRLAQLTNDGLVGVRRAGGVQGAGVVPDLATALPTSTDGGRTYTFHLRKGVRYSTGEPVLAGDIRRGIERSVLYSLIPHLRLAIVGAKACGKTADKAVAADKPRPPCDLSSGIVANDRTGTITFHLTRPNPEFVYQLALPNASAIPQDTPDDLPPGTYLPATGPYMIRSLTAEQSVECGLPACHGRLELVRNPHFQVWSPAAQPAGYPDRIVLETGYTAKQAVARVADGRADLVFGGVPSVDLERLGTRYSSQLHETTGIFTQYLHLNTATPPFNNVDARRAVAYALDRRALNATVDGSWKDTCQLIPPNFAAYRRYCPFTLPGGADEQWTAPNVDRAKALVRKSGTRGAKVVVLAEDFPELSSRVKRTGDVLRGLGYRVSVRRLPVFPPPWMKTHRHSWNLGIMGSGADYPAASQYLAVIGACDPNVGLLNLSRYCDKEVNEQIKAARVQQVSDPGSANEAWSRIDREIVDAAAVIPFGINLRQDFVSRRVGNFLVHPLSGPLIGQMWVQ